jgi:hypothetical protein
MLIPLLIAAVQPADIDPATVAAVRDWTYCLTQTAERLTIAGATPAGVAQAAVAGCAAEENRVVASARGPAAETRRQGLRRSALAYIEGRTTERLASIARDPVSAANQAHGACVGERTAIEASSTSRPAAAIAETALAACRPQEERLRAALAAANGAARADSMIAEVRRSAQAEATALVARARNAGR